MQPSGGVDDHDVAAARRRGLDRVVGDGGRVSPALGPDEVRAGAAGPDLELLLGRGAERVCGGQEHGVIVLAELLRQLADRRRLPGPVDADDEDHGRLGAQVEARRAAQELRGLVAERGAQLAGDLARLQPLDELGRRRDPDVGRDQRLLEPLPGLVVARVERRRRDLLGQRPAALPQRVAQA